MKSLKKVGLLFVDLIEIYLPILTFSTMFIVFILQIIFRYILRAPLTWAYEVTVLSFIWTAMFASCYAFRLGEHIEFTVTYDTLSDKGKTIFRLISHFVLAFSFIISIVPVYKFIDFLSFKTTGVLNIPFNIGFMPYFIMIVDISIRSIIFIVKDVQKLLNWNQKGDVY